MAILASKWSFERSLMVSIVYLNGEFLPEDQAFIPVTDRGFLFGEGVFTTIKVEEGKPEFLSLHLQKLESDCRILEIPCELFKNDAIQELIQRNNALNEVWRLKILVTGGNHLMTLMPYPGHPSPCRLACYPNPVCRIHPNIKTLAFLDHLTLAEYAIKRGFHDALFFDPQGFILETSIANFFWRLGNTVYFPDLSLPVYPGVTLKVLLQAFAKMGLNCQPIKARLEEISKGAQLYICNSMKGFVPVVEIEGTKYERDLFFENSLKKFFREEMNSGM